MELKSKTEMTIPGQAAAVPQNTTMGQKYALTVLKENPDGGHEVQMEFLSARMAMDMAGKTMVDYDSDKKSAGDSTNPVAGLFGKMVGSKITFFMDASNNVDHIEGMDTLMNRLAEGRQPPELTALKSVFGEGYFKQIMSSSRFMPPKAVAPGDSWPAAMEFPMDPLGVMVMNYTLTLQSWEMHGTRNCARMEFSGTIQSRPGATPSASGMAMVINGGTVSGVSWFDPEFGMVIDSQINQDMTINITVPPNPKLKQGPGSQPQNISSKMNQSISIKLDSVK
jgi:hypothetical protein